MIRNIRIILGIRPEVIKMSHVVRTCERQGVDWSMIHTMQDCSCGMGRVFSGGLDCRMRSITRDVGYSQPRHRGQTGRMIGSMCMKKVAILAAYNLESSIGEIVERSKKFVDTVIVVSDGSKDDTNLKAREAGAECPLHTYTRGKGFAVRKGIEYSKKFEPKYIILMDADGQHLPEEIPDLLQPVINGEADLVVGSRMEGELRTSTTNRIGNFLLKLISFIITTHWFTDTESGFRAFKADELYSLELNSISYEIESELLLKSLNTGLKVVEVPIIVPKAVPGVTVRDGIKIGIYKIKTGLKLKFVR